MRTVRRSGSGRVASILLTLALLAPEVRAGAGQEAGVGGDSPIAVGSRLRVTAPGAVEGRVSGRLVEVDERSLVLSIDDRYRLNIPREAITRTEILVGRRSAVGRGALIGASIGLISAALLATDEEGCAIGFDGSGASTTSDCLAVGVLLTASYAGIGGLIGLAVKRDDWRSVSAHTLDVAVAPARGRGVAVGVRWGF